jgi:hypothetical protein
MGSKRTSITLSDEDKVWLESYSTVHQISVAEAIREGIRRLRDTEFEATYQALVKKTEGIWKKGEGLKYQEKTRSDWYL